MDFNHIPLPILLGVTGMALAVIWTAYENSKQIDPTDERFADED